MRTFTSAIDSTFICSSGRLLPVSIVETPSIMMLGSPPPPMRCGVLLPSCVTPGASSASAVKLRLAIGRLVTASVGMVNDRSPLFAWIIGVSPLTSTVSAMPPTSTVITPTSTRLPATTTMPDFLSVLNPLIETSMAYASAGTLGNEKSPVVFVTTGDDFVPRVSLMSTTVAPGMTPP